MGANILNLIGSLDKLKSGGTAQTNVLIQCWPFLVKLSIYFFHAIEIQPIRKQEICCIFNIIRNLVHRVGIVAFS